MQAIRLSNDRFQFMVERNLEQRYSQCIYNRELGKIAMRDPKVGELVIDVKPSGCKVEPKLKNSQKVLAKILLLSVLWLLVASIGLLFFNPTIVIVTAGGMVLLWALQSLQGNLNQEQKMVSFAQEVSMFLEHQLV